VGRPDGSQKMKITLADATRVIFILKREVLIV
jgi:hypothetical protein